MAKKKTKYNKSDIATIRAFSIMIAVIVLIAGALVVNNRSLSYIITFEGKKVPVEYYSLYLNQQKSMYETYMGTQIWQLSTEEGTYVDLVKKETLDQLLTIEVANSKAKDLNIALTDEDITEAQTAADEFETNNGADFMKTMNLNKKTVLELMKSSTLYNKVYKQVSQELVVDEAETQAEYDQYLIDSVQSYITVNVNYIDMSTKESVEEVLAKVKAGRDFVELQKENSLSYKEQVAAATEGAEVPTTVNVVSSGLDQAVIDKAFAMKEGDISDVIELDNGRFMIMKIESYVEPDYPEFETQHKENYVSTKQSEYFQTKMDEWKAEKANSYKVNERVYNMFNFS